MLHSSPAWGHSDGVGAGKYHDILGDGFGGMSDDGETEDSWGDSPRGNGQGDGWSVEMPGDDRGNW